MDVANYMRRSQSPLTGRVWALYSMTCLFALIFSVLAGFTYKDLNAVLAELQRGGVPAPAGFDVNAWKLLLGSTASSAAFAFLLTVAFIVLASVLLMCSLKPLSHPSRKFGRAFVMAAAWWTAAHILDITLRMASFKPSLSLWQQQYNVRVNAPLLSASAAVGYLSAICYVMFGLLLLAWRDNAPYMTLTDEELARLEQRAPSGAP